MGSPIPSQALLTRSIVNAPAVMNRSAIEANQPSFLLEMAQLYFYFLKRKSCFVGFKIMLEELIMGVILSNESTLKFHSFLGKIKHIYKWHSKCTTCVHTVQN